MRNRDRTCLRALLRLTAVAILAAGASACSTVSSLNPWSSDSSAPRDYSSVDAQADAAATATTDNTSYPNVASVPDRPTPDSTAEERQQISDSLVADRGRAQYSADVLRGGTEPAAAPPPPAPPRDLAAVQPATAPDDSAADDSSDDSEIADATAEAAPPAPAPQPAAPPQKVATVSPSVTAPAGAEPAVPMVRAPGAIPGAQPAIPADAPLAFKPSAAPPLDSTVSQFVPASVIARYEATQAAAASVTMPSTETKKVKVTPAAPPKPATTDGDQSSISTGGGSVFVNLDAMGTGARVTKTSASDGVLQTAVYRAPGTTPAAVVFFPGGGHAIDGKGGLQIRAAADAYKAGGGQGYIRVVGHSSSRTPDMSLADHIAYVFRQSQDRAKAVAQALVKAGVPAQSVIVEAVGDTQPVYYESMPKGEDGNRRVEIFIEG